MPEQQQDRQPEEDEPELDEEVLEDLDAPPERGEDVKGGTASSDPFLGRSCG